MYRNLESKLQKVYIDATNDRQKHTSQLLYIRLTTDNKHI